MALAYAHSTDTVRQRLKYTVVYMQVSMGKMQGMPYFSRFGYKKTTPKGGLIWSGRRGASDRNRTNDTGIFSPLLYRLSYRGGQRIRLYRIPPRLSSVFDKFFL